MVVTSSRRIRLATLLLLCFAGHAFAQAPKAAPKAVAAQKKKAPKLPKRTQDITVTVTGTRIVVNGVTFSANPQVSEFEAVYGKADRVWDKQGAINRIYTWDKLGVLIYEPTANPGRARSMTLPFKPMGTDFDPTTKFGGKITVDGFAMKAGTSFDKTKERPGASQPYSSTSVVFAKGDFNVFTKGTDGTLDLFELGLWKNPPPTPAGDSAPADGKTVDSAARPGSIPKRTEDIKVTVTGQKVVVNGVELSSNPRLVDLEALYGKPDRLWDTKGGVNRVHTWDKLGVVVYEPSDNPGRATSMTLPFVPMRTGYDPSTMFAGTVVVDGFSFTAATKFSDAKARPGATQPYGDTSLVFEKGGFNVFLTGPNGTVDLVEISLWKKPPPADAKTADSASTAGKTGGIAAADVRVDVLADGNVTLMGKDIGGKPMLADVKKLLGEPDRVWEKKGGANRIHVWDNLGVLAYEPFDGKVKSLTVLYKPMPTDFSPKNMFNGRIALDGKGFYKFNTIATVKGRSNATQPYGQDTVVFDLGDVHIMAKAAAPTVETLELVDVSFWQKN